jgi:PKD repeat protein
MKILQLIILLILLSSKLYSQGLTNVDESCPAVPVQFNAPSVPGGVYYDWDFCTGDLLGTPNPSVTLLSIIPNSQRPEGLAIAKDGDNWYGFITNRDNNKLLRVRFGDNIDNPISESDITDLGNLGNLLLSPKGIKIIKSKGVWYIFVFSRVAKKVVRIKFGVSLNSPAPIATLVDMPALNNSSSSLIDLVYDADNDRYILLAQDFNNELNILNFGSDLESSPTIIKTNDATGKSWFGIKVIKDGSNWFGLVNTGGGVRDIYHLSFGDNLYSIPTYSKLNLSGITFNTGEGIEQIDWVKEGNSSVAFFLSNQNRFFRASFGINASNISPTFLPVTSTTVSGSNAPLSLSIVSQNSEWHIFIINRSTATNTSVLLKNTFPNICQSSIITSSTSSPEVSFRSTGIKTVNLKILNADSNVVQFSQDQLLILDGVISDFNVSEQCFGSITDFNNISTGIENQGVTWEWLFGDGKTSFEKAPEHSYDAPGLYQVTLNVKNPSGCNNSITKAIRISQGPIADFQVDSLDCETGRVKFIDLSDLKDTDKALGAKIVNRAWNFGDGTGIIISPNTRTTFFKGSPTEYLLVPPYNTSGKYPVALTVTDDVGCSTTIIKEISFREEDRPIVAFTNSSPCAQVPIQFNSQSTIPESINDQVISWNWKFTDLDDISVFSPSNLPNPQAIFLTPGTYKATLTVKGARGCSASLSKEIEVKASLNSRFDVSNVAGVAPLTIKFTNQTIGATSFKWDFGEGQISTAESPTFTFNTPGVYNVNFQAMNNDGCGTISTRRITVDEQPTANEKFLISKLKVFPNPFEAKLNIQLPDNVNFMPYELILCDLFGKVIYQTYINQANGEINTNQIPTGVYLLVFKQNGFTSTRRLIKR